MPPGCISTSKTSQPGIHADPPPSPLSPAVPSGVSHQTRATCWEKAGGGRKGGKMSFLFKRNKKKKNKRVHVDAVSPFMSPEHPRVPQVTLWKCHQSACCGGNTLGTQSCFFHRKLDRLHHPHRSQGLKYSLPPRLPCQQLVFSNANTRPEWVYHSSAFKSGLLNFHRG